jgi:uncharacterized protein YebE (UPF0316 family)
MLTNIDLSVFSSLDASVLFSAFIIFLLRVTDVTIGTLRIGMLVRGYRLLAGSLGFIESLIWLASVAQVLSSLDEPIKAVAYCAGFATGTMLGVTVERWLAMGKSVMQVIAPVGSPQVAPALREAGFVVTVVNAEGRDGNVRIAYSVISKKRQRQALDIVSKLNPGAFITFEEVRTAERYPALVPQTHRPIHRMSLLRR